MKSKLKTNKKINVRRIGIGLVSLIVIVLLCFVFKITVLNRYISAANQAELVSVRAMVINASDGLKTNAPIDAKTGDVYFPEAKLFLKNNPSADYMATQLTYFYEPGDNDNQAYLSISSRPVFNMVAAQLYNVSNTAELFENIPKLQACQRGVDVVYNKYDDHTKTLKKAVHLNNGKTVYLYTEKACPELSSVVDRLKNLQAY